MTQHRSGGLYAAKGDARLPTQGPFAAQCGVGQWGEHLFDITDEVLFARFCGHCKQNSYSPTEKVCQVRQVQLF